MSIIKREKRTIILLLIEIAIPIICLIGIPPWDIYVYPA